MNNLLNYMLFNGKITEKEAKIMKKVDRYDFVINKSHAYTDIPSPLIDNQTISAPHMHAYALRYLMPVLKPGKIILDIGSGSGYLTACFGYAVKVFNHDKKKRGKVIGLEYFKSLSQYSRKILRNKYKELYTYPGHFHIYTKDGKLGMSHLKFDGIHIGADCDEIPPKLYDQLKIGGIMVLPLKYQGLTYFTIVKKTKRGPIINRKMSVRYVPLL